MHSFAEIQLKPIDPDITVAFLGIFIVLIVAALGIAIWQLAPIMRSRHRKKIAEKTISDSAIWLDETESTLHRGQKALNIEPGSLEYYVCKITFDSPDTYHDDIDIFYEYDEAKQTNRGVYQAVRRLNEKGRASLGLSHDLFKRSKESTSVNGMYREHITRRH